MPRDGHGTRGYSSYSARPGGTAVILCRCLLLVNQGPDRLACQKDIAPQMRNGTCLTNMEWRGWGRGPSRRKVTGSLHIGT